MYLEGQIRNFCDINAADGNSLGKKKIKKNKIGPMCRGGYSSGNQKGGVGREISYMSCQKVLCESMFILLDTK